MNPTEAVREMPNAPGHWPCPPAAKAASPVAGWGVLATWCVTVGMSFSFLFGNLEAKTAVSAMSDLDAGQVSAWLKQSPDFRPGRTTVARIGAARCSCDPMTREQWQGLRARWSDRETTFYDVAAPTRRSGSLANIEIAIADTAGRLVYAGPFDDSPMCGNRSAMDAFVARAHTASTAAPTIPSTRACSCPGS